MPDVRADLDFSAIVPGSVVTHSDRDNSHHAIVLEIMPNQLAYILMFSSKELGIKCRSVTKDELALAGYVNDRKTYMSLKRRPIWELYPRGIEFPKHRIESLKREFFGDRSERKQLLNVRDNGVESLDQ